jgi:hypothetical protein
MIELSESHKHEQTILKEVLRNLRGKISPITFRDEFKDDKEAGWIIQRLVFLYGIQLGKWDVTMWDGNTSFYCD